MSVHAWNNYKDKMKAKRELKRKKSGTEHVQGQRKTVLTNTLTVQHLSQQVCGKLQKYTRIGAREFVPYPYDELTIDGIKAACLLHFTFETGTGYGV